MNSQTQLLSAVETVKDRVTALFSSYPDDVHGMVHASHVAAHAAHIAEQEGAHILLTTMAAWLHDIGRVIEAYPDQFPEYDASLRHHELSYQLLRAWFRDDRAFDLLSDDQKKELLYAVRYHWNDAAEKYESAIILRDADKLDALGDRGVARSIAFHPDDMTARMADMRLRYQMYYHLRTTTAKVYADKHQLLEAIDHYLLEQAKQHITEVEL